MKVIGLVVSVGKMGIAHDDGHSEIVDASELRGMLAVDAVHRRIGRLLTDESPDAVAIEGYSFALKGRALVGLGEINGMARWTIWDAGLSWLEASPASLRRYAVGVSTASTSQILTGARARLGYQGNDLVEADALWLRALGHAVAGEPIVELPKSHQSAVLAVVRHSGRPN